MDKIDLANIETDLHLLGQAVRLLKDAIGQKDSVLIKEHRARVTFWAKSIVRQTKQ